MSTNATNMEVTTEEYYYTTIGARTHPSQRDAFKTEAFSEMFYRWCTLIDDSDEGFDVYEIFEKERQLLMLLSHISEEETSKRTLVALKQGMLDSVNFLREGCKTGSYLKENVESTMFLHAVIAEDMTQLLDSLVKRGFLKKHLVR